MSTYSVGQQYVSISVSTIGSNQIVAAVAGKKIRVVSYVLVCSVAETVTWRSGSSPNLTGGMSFAAQAGVSSHYCPLGLFQTASGSALNLVLTTGGNIVAGHLVFVLDPQ